MEKYKVGTLQDSKSFYDWSSSFYPTLKARVVERLATRGLSVRGGSGSIHVKAIFLLVTFWVALMGMCLLPGMLMPIISCLVMGISASFIGTCIQHDGSHGAFSNYPIINKLAGWTLDMIGASAFTWEIQHMLGHHPYTNLLDVAGCGGSMQGDGVGDDQESDPDVFSSYPFMRMHPYHKREWYHRYQHMYAPVLFAAMTLTKVFDQDFSLARTKRLYHIDATCRYGSLLNNVRFWAMKIITAGYMIFLPIYFKGLSQGILLFVVGHMACGEMLATMFIVNHVIEGVAFAKKNEMGREDTLKPVTVSGSTPMQNTQEKLLQREGTQPTPLNDWAAVQCQTSVNWSVGSRFWNHFSGGLNHQIEHHLFPSICHTNYVHIADVVQSTCAEFGVPYQHEKSLFSAYWGMLHISSLWVSRSR